jgi:hypothetical protein
VFAGCLVDAQECSVSGRKDNVDTQADFDSVINSWYSSAGRKGNIRFTSPGAYVLPYTVQITDEVCLEVSGSRVLPHS